MKLINKISIAVCLLLSFSIMATGQVKQIDFDPFKDYNATIKVNGNQLFVITPIGVYSQELDESGNLTGESLLSSEIFESLEYGVVDFLKSGEKLIVATGRTINEGNAILKSTNNGKTWIDISDMFYDSESLKVNFGQCYSSRDEIYVQIDTHLYYSIDFGESFECTTNMLNAEQFECHNFNSNTVIFISYEPYIWEYNALVSFDAGRTIYNKWDSEGHDYDLDGHMTMEDVAFHYSDSNKIIISADMCIIYSDNNGKSWERISNPNVSYKVEFDKRGSDRLYGTKWDTSEYRTQNKLYYSDDFGATWNELCELGLGEDDYVVDFVQHGSKIYTYSKNYKVHQIDLELLESAVEEIVSENGNVSVSVVGDNLQVNSQTAVSTVEIYNIGGVKLVSQAGGTGGIDIASLPKGSYVARLTTADGNTVSIKFNK